MIHIINMAITTMTIITTLMLPFKPLLPAMDDAGGFGKPIHKYWLELFYDL